MNKGGRKTDLKKTISMKPEEKFLEARDWFVHTCPPNNSLKGNIVPDMMSYKRRRLSIEIYKVSNENTANYVDDNGFYESCYLIIMDKKSQQKGRDDSSIISVKNINGPLQSIPGDSVLDSNSNLCNFEGWEIRYKFPLKSVSIDSKYKNNVTFKLLDQGKIHQRKIKFESTEEMEECTTFITELHKEESARLKAKYEISTKDLKKNVRSRDQISLLVEIVGSIDLPIRDMKSSDPYVVCYYDRAKVHKTKHIRKDLNPIFTLKHNNMFLINTTIEALFKGDGLRMKVVDYDKIGKNENLGTCLLPPRMMYAADGERLSLKLENPEEKGLLHIRIRHATDNDKDFMEKFENQTLATKKKNFLPVMTEVIEKSNQSQGGKMGIHSMMTKNEKFEKSVAGIQLKKYRVRPTSDPKRPEETEWLSATELCSEVMQDSREWIETGSGRLGRLFVEILEAKDLANMDTGGFAGNKTDSFCCLIYGDSEVKTDVIDDCLSPKWMPWMKRAFIFNINHPSAELFVGLFDFDKMDMHDLLGRISIDVTNFKPDTVYDLFYTLYPSSSLNEREEAGKVRLRLRIEIDDDRLFLLSSSKPPNTIYVNVQSKKDFDVVHQIVNGNVNMKNYSMKNLYAFFDELYSYQSTLIYIQEALITLLLWRGHHKISVFGRVYLIPLHSILAFTWAVAVIEYPQLLPSFFFFSIAWFMLACMMFRRSNPNPWNRCKSFQEILQALVFGSFPASKEIISFKNKADIEIYETNWVKKFKHATQVAKEAEALAEEVLEEEEKLADEVNGTDITTKRDNGGMTIDPFKPYMEPIQIYLALACHWLRYIRNIILWQECFLSFWITLVSFMLSFACLFLPWFFILQWTSRIILWTVFGPWMKLVDIYYWAPREKMTDEEKENEKCEATVVRKRIFRKQMKEARIQKERAKKLKDMKEFMFGKYIIKVPVLKEDRHWDIPLAESSAIQYKPKPLPLAEVAMKEAGYHRVRLPGQNLEGDMIPTIQSTNFTEAPIGQATKRHALSESDTAAYTKVGSVVAGAAIITYYGVPLLASFGAIVFGS